MPRPLAQVDRLLDQRQPQGLGEVPVVGEANRPAVIVPTLFTDSKRIAFQPRCPRVFSAGMERVAATNARIKPVDIEKVQKWLGHASISTT